jgi:hypothetical protein
MTEYSNIQVSEVAGSEPVNLDEAKAWIGGLEGVTDFDGLISSMIKASRLQVEKETNLALVAKDITLDVCLSKDDDVLLPYSKEVNMVMVNSLNSSYAETVLTEGTDYFLRGNSVRLTIGRYSISYTVVPVVSDDLKEVIKMDVADKFKHRGDNGLSEAAKQRAQSHMIPWL